MRGRKVTSVVIIFAIAVLISTIIAQNPVVLSTNPIAQSLGSGGAEYSEFNVPLYANGYDGLYSEWTRVGASPYLSAVDYTANYIHAKTNNARIGAFTFEDVASYDGGKIYIEFYAYSKGSNDRIIIYLYNETTAKWDYIESLQTDSVWGWKSTTNDVSARLNTVAKINDAKVYLEKTTSGLEDVVAVDALRLRPEQQILESRSRNYKTDLAVTNPQYANDSNLATYASFTYSSVSGTKKGLELYYYEGPARYPGQNTNPLPGITSVDMNMRYNASLNTAANPNDKYRIVYYVSPSVTAQVLTDWRTDNATYKYVSGLDSARPGWDRIGTTPYLGSADGTNYIENSVIIRPNGDGAKTGWTGTYTAWDDTVPDGDTTCVSATANLAECSNLEDATRTWSIDRIRVTVRARPTVPTDGQIMLFLYIGSSVYNATSPQSLLTTTYSNYQSEWTTNPATAAAWSWGDIASLQAGVFSSEVGVFTGEMRVTQLYVEIVPSDTIGDFAFEDVTAYQGGKVFLEVYAKQTVYGQDNELDTLEAWVWSQSLGSYVLAQEAATWVKPMANSTGTYSWMTSLDVSSLLDSVSQINNAKVYLVHIISGDADPILIDAMRLKIHSPGYIFDTTTVTWANRPEPNNGVWDWTDLNNTRFVVETQADAIADPGCSFSEYEAWVTAYSPKAKVRVQTTINTGATPTTPVTMRPNLDTSSKTWTVFPAGTTQTIRPDADGSYAQWAPTPAGAHWSTVDEASASDADFVAASAKALRDTYGLANPSAQSWNPGTVKVTIRAKQTTGDEAIRIILASGASTYNGSLVTPLTVFGLWSSEWYVNPINGLAWTWTDINNLQCGIWSTQVGATWVGTVTVSQVFVEVLQPHFDVVDEASQNGKLDYIYATATGRSDLFELENPVAQVWTIGSVRVNAYANQTTGDEKIYLQLSAPGQSAVFSPALSVPTGTDMAKVYYDWGFNPFTGATWTWGDLASLQAGVRSLAVSTWTGEMRVTQVYVEIRGPGLKADIRVEGALDLWGYTVTVSYNTTLLDGPAASGLAPYTAASPSSFNDEGGYMYFGFNMGLSALFGCTGNVTAARIYYTPATTGLTYLNFSGVALTTSRSQPIPYTSYNGVFGNVLPPDVAVTAVTPSATLAFQSYNRSITVDVTNQGASAATFDVTLYYYPGKAIGTQNVVGLGSGMTTTKTLKWNTTGVPYGNYTIFAVAATMPYEIDTADNTRNGPWQVMVTIPGDANGDRTINVFDILAVKSRWGRTPASPDWIPEYDVNVDDAINVFDILTVKSKWGQSW